MFSFRKKLYHLTITASFLCLTVIRSGAYQVLGCAFFCTKLRPSCVTLWCYLCCNRSCVFAQKHDVLNTSGNHEFFFKKKTQLQSSLNFGLRRGGAQRRQQTLSVAPGPGPCNPEVRRVLGWCLGLRQVVDGSGRRSLSCVAPRKRRCPLEKVLCLSSVDVGSGPVCESRVEHSRLQAPSRPTAQGNSGHRSCHLRSLVC